MLCCKRVPAWFNIYGGSRNSPEDVTGIELATRYVHGLIDEEVRGGIRPEKIIVGGYSQVGPSATARCLPHRPALPCVVFRVVLSLSTPA